jgi:hypothetical protein
MLQEKYLTTIFKLIQNNLAVRMVFEVRKFLGKPDLEEFDHLKKEDLVLLAKHLKIDFKVSMRKQTIKKTIPDEPPIFYGQKINAVTQVSQQKTKVSKNFSKNLLCYKKSI